MKKNIGILIAPLFLLHVSCTEGLKSNGTAQAPLPVRNLHAEKAFKEIDRVLKSGADFYMSVPIEERNKVYFNAHRAFNEDYLLKELLGNYEVLDRKYIYGNDFTTDFAIAAVKGGALIFPFVINTSIRIYYVYVLR